MKPKCHKSPQNNTSSTSGSCGNSHEQVDDTIGTTRESPDQNEESAFTPNLPKTGLFCEAHEHNLRFHYMPSHLLKGCN